MAIQKGGTKSNTVYEHLKYQIITLKLPPGQQILEVQVAKHLNVSRTPVREAIIKLIHEGYLLEEDGKAYVYHLTMKDLKDIFHVRESLEAKAAKLAVADVTEEFLLNLKEINEKLKHSLQHKDYSEAFRWDNQFHDMFIELCGNKHIIEILSKYNLQVSRIRYLTIMNTHKLNRTVMEHDQIISAFEQRDADLVEKLTSFHVENAQKTIEQYENLTSMMNIGLYNMMFNNN